VHQKFVTRYSLLLGFVTTQASHAIQDHIMTYRMAAVSVNKGKVTFFRFLSGYVKYISGYRCIGCDIGQPTSYSHPHLLKNGEGSINASFDYSILLCKLQLLQVSPKWNSLKEGLDLQSM